MGINEKMERLNENCQLWHRFGRAGSTNQECNKWQNRPKNCDGECPNEVYKGALRTISRVKEPIRKKL